MNCLKEFLLGIPFKINELISYEMHYFIMERETPPHDDSRKRIEMSFPVRTLEEGGPVKEHLGCCY